jgi:hypothetical protein
VLDALAQPTLGHLDPAFGAVMDEVAELLRATFRTQNRTAFPVSATGSGGMQTMVDNLVRPGDRILCGVHGLFGERMADALTRRGAEVVRVEAEWGRAIPTERLVEAASEPFAALFVVHGETSTGVAQPLDALAEACAQHGALLFIDCVTSLAGHPLDLDAAGVDAAFSGSQKCLNCPPGLAPFTANDRALERVQGSPSWYFDLQAVLDYWQRRRRPRVPPHRADEHGRRAARGAGDRPGGGARTALGAATPRPTRRCALRWRSSASSGSRPTASSCTRCWRCGCPTASKTRRCAARCCPSTGSRSPRRRARSPGRPGASA